jgi:hypothetical protein
MKAKKTLSPTMTTIPTHLKQIPTPLLKFVDDITAIVVEKRATLILARHLLTNLLQWSSYQYGHRLWYVDT